VSKTVRIKTKPGDVLFEFAPDGLYVYVGYKGGARVKRSKAKRLRRLLKAHLKQS
jgi:Uri superfamily endonuclease